MSSTKMRGIMKIKYLFLVPMMAICLVAGLFVFSGCGNTNRMSTPRDVQLNGSQNIQILNWQTVKGAESYVVRVNSEEFEVTDNSFIIRDLGNIEGAHHRVSVKARGQGGRRDSRFSQALTVTKLPSPTNFEIVNGVLRWSMPGVERGWVSHYDIYHIESGTSFTPRNSRGVVANIMQVNLAAAFTLSEQNTIRVMAFGAVSAGLVFNSDWVEMTFSRPTTGIQVPVIVESTAPSAPTNLRLEGNALVWDAHIPANPSDNVWYNLDIYVNGRHNTGVWTAQTSWSPFFPNPGMHIVVMVRVFVNTLDVHSNFSDVIEFGEPLS